MSMTVVMPESAEWNGSYQSPDGMPPPLTPKLVYRSWDGTPLLSISHDDRVTWGPGGVEAMEREVLRRGGSV